MEKNFDVIIIGAGTAGLSAAIYATRAELSVLCIESYIHGGQIINTPDIMNYPAIEIISGADFATKLYSHATNLGAQIVYEKVESVDFSEQEKVINTNENSYKCKAVIIATGARHKELGCNGEDKFRGRGVSYCATCDGAFYKGLEVAVAGGGNTALEEALYLSKICKKVHLVHRRDEFRASAVIAKSVMKTENIEVHFNREIVSIEGSNDKVEYVTLKDNINKAEEKLEVSGVFIAIGLKPDNELFVKWIDLDESGYVIAGENCNTKTAGVFVAGDTRKKDVRQLITAAADGAVAATESSRYINSL